MALKREGRERAAPVLHTFGPLDWRHSVPLRIVLLLRIDCGDDHAPRVEERQKSGICRRLNGVGGGQLLPVYRIRTRVTATSLHPGFVRTEFGAEDQAWFFSAISHVVRPFLKTPAEGAHTSIYLASSPDVDGVTGQFFVNGKPKTANKAGTDPAITARLWQTSADLVRMTLASS